MKRFHKMVMLCINYFTSIRYAYVFECLSNLVDVLIDHLYRLKHTGAQCRTQNILHGLLLFIV